MQLPNPIKSVKEMAEKWKTNSHEAGNLYKKTKPTTSIKKAF
jgi:hypothetical protein